MLPVSSRTQIQPALLRGPPSKEHRNTAWQRHRRTLAQDLQPGASHAASTPPTQPTLSEGTLPDDAGGESQNTTPQTENPGEITLSGPIDDTSVLAEHTQQIRQLLRSPPLLSAGTTSSPSWRRPSRRRSLPGTRPPREGDVPGCPFPFGGAPAAAADRRGFSFLDVGRGGPADPGGLAPPGWPWRPPDAGGRSVRVYSSFLCLALRLPPAACPARSSPPVTTSSGHGHRRDRIAVVAHRPAHLLLPGPAVAVRSCCLPGPPPWILPARVPRGAFVAGGATLLPLLAPRHHPLLSDLGAGLRVLPRQALHRRRRLRRPRRDRLVPKHRRPHALLPRCNHARRPWTATFWPHSCHRRRRLAVVAACVTPRLRPSAAWPITCDATSTRLGRPALLASARLPGVRHVSTSSDTSSSGSGSSSPPAAPRASRRLRGLSPSDATPPVRSRRLWPPGRGASSPASIGEPSAFVYLSSSGLSTSVGSVSVPGSLAPSPAASPAPSEQPLRDAGGTSSPTPHIGVPTPTGVPVDSPVLGSSRSPDPASPRPSSSARQVLVPYDFGPSSSSNGASPALRGSSPASPVGDAAFLLHDDDEENIISYDVTVSSPPLDAGSSPVVLPGSPVSPASSPSPPASVDEAAADPDDVQEHPESDPATLRMPPDHTRLLEDQVACSDPCCGTHPPTSHGPIARKHGRGPSPWLSRWCVSHRCVLVANAASPTQRTRSTYSGCTAATVDARFG
ncbi:hypothetical protein MRX96_018144 [Rhipicephalus microplus]